MTEMSGARMAMINSQLRTNQVTDKAVLAAMADIPRELFVAAKWRPLAYMDQDIEIAGRDGDRASRSMMKPMVFARMVQAAEIGSEDIVLDIGCGTGYSAAVLARIAGAVVAVEEDADLAERAASTLAEIGAANVEVVTAPLTEGCRSEGEYDVILIEGAVESVPQAILDQLKIGGRLVTVVGGGNAASATVYSRSGGGIGKRSAFNAAAPMLPGFTAEAGFVF